MLLAFSRRKVRRLFSETADVDEVIETLRYASEDTLTAMVLGRVQYLSAGLAWSLLTGVVQLMRGAMPPEPQECRLEFWPSYEDPEDPGGWVEPDVVWVDPRIVLGIEVKWRGTQDPAQLDKEYRALAQAFPGREVAILALGGMGSTQLDELKTRCATENLLVLSWAKFAQGVRAREAELASGPAKAILSDIALVLAERGLGDTSRLTTFATLPAWPLGLALPWTPIVPHGGFLPLVTLGRHGLERALSPLADWRIA